MNGERRLGGAGRQIDVERVAARSATGVFDLDAGAPPKLDRPERGGRLARVGAAGNGDLEASAAGRRGGKLDRWARGTGAGSGRGWACRLGGRGDGSDQIAE